jgi:hypothetical protein
VHPYHFLKIALTITAMLAVPRYTGAQEKTDFTYTVSSPFTIPDKFGHASVLSDESGYLQISSSHDKFLLFQKFNQELKLEKEQTIDLTKLPDGYQHVAFVKIGGKAYWFYCTWGREEKKERLFVQEIDIPNCSLKASARELASADKLAWRPDPQGPGGSKWWLHFATDSSRLVVQYTKSPAIKADIANHDVVGFHVFDTDLREIWSNEFELPYTELYMDNEEYLPDHDGKRLHARADI